MTGTLGDVEPNGSEKYGLGVGVWPDRERLGLVLQHSGVLIPGYSSVYLVLPQDGVVVVALANIADDFEDHDRVIAIGRDLAEEARSLN